MANAVQSFGGFFRTFAFGRRPEWTAARIVLLVVLTVVVFKYLVLVRRIESVSMLPTLPEGSIHLIYRRAYSDDDGPRRGDIVAVRTSGETILYVKRVIGLPGERVEIRRGIVHINGEPLEESYVQLRRRPWNWPVNSREPRELGNNEYFIIGDNRSMGQEFHDFGVVQRSRIIGKVIW